MAEPGVAEAALRRAQRRKASPRVLKALMLAGITESGLQQKKYNKVGSGDRDSVGFLQQRPSQGWGPAGESVEKDTDQFLDQAIKLNQGFKGSAGKLAQAVQRSAYPERYDQHSAEADKLIRQILGSTKAPRLRDVSSRTSSLGQILGSTQDVPKKRSVFDIIRGLNNVQPDSTSLDDQLAQSQQMLMAAIERKNEPSTSRGKVLNSVSEPRVKGAFKITGPNPKRLKPQLVSFAERVASVYGKPLVGSDGSGHSYRTATGGVSQHSTGNATDIPASGAELTRMGQAALIAAGMPEAQARKQTGGLYNVNGHQIIFHDRKRISGSAHDDHLHISAR